MSLGRIIRKVNEAKKAIRSVKGIKSKWDSIGYNSVANTKDLIKQRANAKQLIDNQRTALDNIQNKSRRMTSVTPSDGFIPLQYPIEESLENYIVFKNIFRLKPF